MKCFHFFSSLSRCLSIQLSHIFLYFDEADQVKGYQHEDYGDSDEDYGDDDDDDHVNDRKQFPFFTPVTPYPPVYCTYVFFSLFFYEVFLKSRFRNI